VRVGFSWENINSDFIILTVLFLLWLAADSDGFTMGYTDHWVR
jgi:hypothetical protein